MSKYKILTDELKIRGGGLYCVMPYERLDKNKKAVFKVGVAVNFEKRFDSGYHTYFPEGVYYVAFINGLKLARKTRNDTTKEETEKQYYVKIEKFILKKIEELGGQRIKSTTRTRNVTNKGGDTEWFYTNTETIHKAFAEASEKYNGNLHLYHLEGTDPETNKFTSINETARERESEPNKYVGKIIYKL